MKKNTKQKRMIRRKTEAHVITETLFLDHCWVCFTKRAGDSTFEEHHVVPRCYGGEKGPTVSLCADCHTKVHNCANELYKHGYAVPPYENHISRERCLYLATVIVNARIALENIDDVNKRYVYSGFLDGSSHAKLVKLCDYYKMSQQKLFRYMIDELYKRNFSERS